MDLFDVAGKTILENKDEDFQEAFYNLSSAQRWDVIVTVKALLEKEIDTWVTDGKIIIEFNTEMKTCMVVPNISK